MISVIIPTHNDEATLVRTLSGLVPAVVDGLIREVIVADSGSGDATLEIAESTGCRIVTGGSLWQGCREAKGDWLLILHPDSQLAEGWGKPALEHIRHHPLRAGYFRLAFDDPSWRARLRAKGLALRARWLDAPGWDHGLLLSRALYDAAVGVKDPDMDMGLGRARLRAIPAVLVTDEARFNTKKTWPAAMRDAFRWVLHGLGFPPRP